EPGAAFVGPRLAGDDVHHRGLARAVRADDAAQLARLDVERQRVQRLEAVEADGELLEVEDVLGDLHAAPASRRAAIRRPAGQSPTRPRGRNSVTPTNNAPSA